MKGLFRPSEPMKFNISLDIPDTPLGMTIAILTLGSVAILLLTYLSISTSHKVELDEFINAVGKFLKGIL
jgi:hypothetical protein